MKKTFLLLFLFTASLNAQTIKAIYATQPLSGLKDGEKTEKYKEQKKPILFSYTFSKNKSLQKLIVTQKSSIDTIYIDHFGKKFETTKTNIVPTTESYYKDFIVNKYNSLTTIDGRNEIVDESLHVYDWKIEDDKKEIKGYTCQKATTTKKFRGINLELTAWFSEDIPINDGPYSYHGLPGLIVQLEIGEFSLVTLEKLKVFEESTDLYPPSN